jgi:hypothetical protein
MEIYFDAKKVGDAEAECKGKIKVHELNQDDDEMTIDITLDK